MKRQDFSIHDTGTLLMQSRYTVRILLHVTVSSGDLQMPRGSSSSHRSTTQSGPTIRMRIWYPSAAKVSGNSSTNTVRPDLRFQRDILFSAHSATDSLHSAVTESTATSILTTTKAVSDSNMPDHFQTE